MAVQPEDEIGPQLRELGFDPADVRHVVLTHLHTDHAGGLHHFPASAVHASRDELALATGRLGKVYGYLPHRWPKWLQPRPVPIRRPRLRPVRGEPHAGRRRDPAADRGPHARPPLRRGPQRRRLCCWPADTSYTEALMHAGSVDGVAATGVYRETPGRIQGLRRAVVYLPTHDPDSTSRLAAATRA